MREILFRGKSIVTNEWVYGCFLKTKIDGKEVEIIIPQEEFSDAFLKNIVYQVLPETVGQYSGLEDENEVNIFEGDVIQFGEYKYRVEYHTGLATFAMFNLESAPLCSLSGAIAKMSRIVGSIYDITNRKER